MAEASRTSSYGARPPLAAASSDTQGHCSQSKLCSADTDLQDVSSLPDEALILVFKQLNQSQRALVACCCQRWARLSRTAPGLWASVRFEVAPALPGAAARSESFLAWLIPRAQAVQRLRLIGRGAAPGAAGAPAAALGGGQSALVWANLVAACSLVAPSLQSLTLEWPDVLVVSGWAGALRSLQSATLVSPQVVLRPGLGALPALADLRLRSHAVALTFVGLPPPVPPLPTALRKLRLERCALLRLPPALTALTGLLDLDMTDNNLHADDMQSLSCLVSLQQLTLMRCRLARLPASLSTLTSLRVLYLDMGFAGPPLEGALPMAEQADAVLAPLERLAILSMGACHLREVPRCLMRATALRVLYLDDNELGALPTGSYLGALRVLGVDWRVLFASHARLGDAPRLTKLCLTSIGKGVEAVPHGPEDTDAVVRSLVQHPSLRQVLLPMADGQREAVHIAPLNVVAGAACYLDVRAVTYGGISNEWISSVHEWDAEEALEASVFRSIGGRGAVDGRAVT